MAWTFGDEIKALTGYDAMGSDDSVSGEDFYIHTNQWLKDAAKEVIHLLPPHLKQKCATISIVNATNGTTLDLDGIGEVIQVTRKNADSGYHAPCRKIPSMYGDSANDSTNMMYYATETDPVYWTTSNSSDVSTLFVKPTPTDAQPSNVYHISYPSPSNFHNETIIDNFPDEAENLVVLRAAITAAEYLLAAEEDVEIYGAIITTLRAQYKEGVQALKAGEIGVLQQPGAKK